MLILMNTEVVPMKLIIKNYLRKISLFVSRFIKITDSRFIYYHDVILGEGSTFDAININKFREQMIYIKNNNYKTLSFRDLDKMQNKSNFNYINKDKAIGITFDDGYRNNYEIVFPIMRELNLKFNIFLEVKAIGKENYLTWDMVNEMKNSGLVCFGAHTYSHKDARFINNNDFEKEINYANKIIFYNTQLEVNDFCFPYGAYNTRIVTSLDESKLYKRLYTSDGRRILEKKNLIIIGRVGIENEDSKNVFSSKLEGRYNLYYFSSRFLKNLIRGNKNEIIR